MSDIIIDREQCPICLDSTEDAVAVYEDHKHCHKCDKHWFNVTNDTKEIIQSANISGFITGECLALEKRCISLQTCKFMDYQIGPYTGHFGQGKNRRFASNEAVQIANYYNETNQKIVQKIRSRYKEFFIVGDGKNMPLYGEWKWQPNKNLFVVVVEGEIDQLTVLQVQGLSYPVYSIPKGTGDAKKSILARLQRLLCWKHVVLGLDNTDDGHEAMQECVPLFEPGKVRLITWQGKDPNEMLQAGKKEEITKCIWQAKEISPKRSVTVSDIIERVLVKPQYGLDFPWKSMTEMTYGLKGGEIYVIVGGIGIGKTGFMKDIICNFLDKTGAGIFSFEQSPEDTVRRYIGAKLGLKIHKPGITWNENNIKNVALEFTDKLWLYDHDGAIDIEDVIYTIRYWNKAKDIRLFVIDNLKSLGIVLDKKELIQFMNKLKAVVKELKIDIFLVSHVNKNVIQQSTNIGFSSQVTDPHSQLTDTSIRNTLNKFRLDWPNGRMPSESDIEGGNDIAAIADYVFALARNKESEDRQVARTLQVKNLKCGRTDSEYAGTIFELYYQDNGNLIEVGRKEEF